jgi:poly(3-hydroxybutyrate) depolymerase
MRTLFLVLFISACGNKENSDDTGHFVAPGGGGVSLPLPASSGECPDMSTSHTTSFLSSGEERTVTIVVPDNPTTDMPLVYFFHGLLDPGSTPAPSDHMATALNLQSMANEAGVAFVLPQSGLLERLGFAFFMWNVAEPESTDIVLFDDLRSCAYDELAIDLSRVHAMGMSGGALFTTVVARERGDILASIVEMSGGSDIDMLTFDVPLSVYGTSESTMPALLISGGADDQWPGGGLTLVDFSAATDTLQEKLVADGHFVVRCEHSLGHQVPHSAIDAAWDWVDNHLHGEDSPFRETGITDVDSLSDWCIVAN